MSNWFTDEQWKDYVSARTNLQQSLPIMACEHIREGIEAGKIEISIGAANYSDLYSEIESPSNPSHWFIKDNSDWGPDYEMPILYCPWCGVKLPEIPKIYIGR